MYVLAPISEYSTWRFNWNNFDETAGECSVSVRSTPHLYGLSMVNVTVDETTHGTVECPEKTKMSEAEAEAAATLGKQLANEINVSGVGLVFGEGEPVIRR